MKLKKYYLQLLTIGLITSTCSIAYAELSSIIFNHTPIPISIASGPTVAPGETSGVPVYGNPATWIFESGPTKIAKVTAQLNNNNSTIGIVNLNYYQNDSSNTLSPIPNYPYAIAYSIDSNNQNLDLAFNPYPTAFKFYINNQSEQSFKICNNIAHGKRNCFEIPAATNQQIMPLLSLSKSQNGQTVYNSYTLNLSIINSDGQQLSTATIVIQGKDDSYSQNHPSFATSWDIYQTYALSTTTPPYVSFEKSGQGLSLSMILSNTPPPLLTQIYNRTQKTINVKQLLSGNEANRQSEISSVSANSIGALTLPLNTVNSNCTNGNFCPINWSIFTTNNKNLATIKGSVFPRENQSPRFNNLTSIHYSNTSSNNTPYHIITQHNPYSPYIMDMAILPYPINFGIQFINKVNQSLTINPNSNNSINIPGPITASLPIHFSYEPTENAWDFSKPANYQGTYTIKDTSTNQTAVIIIYLAEKNANSDNPGSSGNWDITHSIQNNIQNTDINIEPTQTGFYRITLEPK